jgi:hypothetical protein
MKTTDKNAMEIAKRGGAIAAGDWTRGTGNFISKRAIPAMCREIDADQIGSLRGKSAAAARKLLKTRPKVRKLIVVTDWRNLNKVAKAAA